MINPELLNIDILYSSDLQHGICADCDHFPGDGIYEKHDYWGKCPFYQEFKNGTYNGYTLSEEIDCKDFFGDN